MSSLEKWVYRVRSWLPRLLVRKATEEERPRAPFIHRIDVGGKKRTELVVRGPSHG